MKGLLNPLLEAFMAVVKAKSIHGGARLMHISQTAMTQRIHNLEGSLKTTLFIRTRQGIHLTSEGEELHRYCLSMRDLSGEVLAKITGISISSLLRITISGPSSIMSSRIIPACIPLIKKYSQLYINFDVNDSNDLSNLLRSGHSQLAIISADKISREMKRKTLIPEKYVLVCCSAWKKRKLRDIISSERIIDFDSSDQTTIRYLKQHKLLQFAQTERLFINCNESLIKMLSQGYGYGVLTTEHSKSYIDKSDLIPLNAGKYYENPLTLAWYDRPQSPKYFTDLLKVII